MKMGIISVMKLLAVVVVGLFILKLSSKYLANKFPNKLTSSVDTVIQTA